MTTPEERKAAATERRKAKQRALRKGIWKRARALLQGIGEKAEGQAIRWLDDVFNGGSKE